MEIMIDSDALVRILAYVSENKIFAVLEAESKKILDVKAIKHDNSWTY